MRLWISGVLDEEHGIGIRAVCSTEEKAVALCEDMADFVGPVDVDTVLCAEEKKVEWPGAYFPLAPVDDFSDGMEEDAD